MNGSRVLADLLPRTVALVIAAATLLVVPAASGSSYAAPEHCSATDVRTCAVDGARDGDTDGDGLLDSGDGCPTVASSNPTGCPTASRKVSLKWAKAKKRLETRITSPVKACSSRARVVLWRVRPQRDVKVVGVTATASGRYRFKVRQGARYYVTVPPSYSSGVAECARATSRKVLAPRS